jgi:predicted RND superfamily exporter protein
MIKQNSDEALSAIQIPGSSSPTANQDKKIPREVLRAAWELLPTEEKRNCTLKLVLINHNFFTAYFREIWLIILLTTLIVIFLSLLLFIKEKAWAISVLMTFYISVLLASLKLFSQYRKCCISK